MSRRGIQFANDFRPNPAGHSGLNFAYFGGTVRDDNSVSPVNAGSVLLTANSTNYVELDPFTPAVSANTTGYTSGRIPLATVVTGASTITSVADKRTSFFVAPLYLNLQWTESGNTTTNGVTTYSVPVAAQGKSTLIPGDGFAFYTNYTLNASRTQLTFDSVDDVPETGSALEFLYSDSVVAAETGTSFFTWTNSGATTTNGTTTYTVAPAAQGKLSLVAGNGQIFYDPATYTFNTNKTQIIFNSVNDVPLTGSKLEFFYSDTGLSSGTALSSSAPTANTGSASSGASSDAARADHNHGDATTLKSATTSVNVGSATAPTAGQVLTATSGTAATWQTPSGGPKVATLRDEKAANTNAQTVSEFTWTTRDLNTENDPQGIVTLSSNQFTLGAGSYLIQWETSTGGDAFWISRLRNISDSATVARTLRSGATRPCTGSYLVSLSGEKTFAIQIYQDTSIGGALVSGSAVNLDGENEVYTTVTITKLS